jgi:hypothetical protein
MHGDVTVRARAARLGTPRQDQPQPAHSCTTRTAAIARYEQLLHALQLLSIASAMATDQLMHDLCHRLSPSHVNPYTKGGQAA